MEKDRWRNRNPEQMAGNGAPERASRPAPGKVTRTSKLSPSRGAAVQRKAVAPTPGGAATLKARSPWELTMDPWMDAAHRGVTALAERETAFEADVSPGHDVQMRGGQEEPAGDVHRFAEQGLSGTASPLPYLDQIQRSFGSHDVSGVKAHTGGPAARAAEGMGAGAYATGDHVAFREAPDLHTAAHEAAHVVQQRGGVQLHGGVGEVEDEYERHADAVADRTVRGLSAVDLLEPYRTGPGSLAAVQRQASAGGSRPADQVRAAADTSAVFTVLRRACPVSGDTWSATGTLATDGDPDLTRELAAKLGTVPDDVWLATQLRRFGAEPLWPAAAIEERARRANAPGPFGGRAWAPEAGIGVQVGIPDREAGEERIAPIQVYFFPGRSGRRAMVVGGVHGTEHQGVEVVERLRAQLEADSRAGNPPFFSTVLVPTLIQRSDTAGRRNVCGPNSSGVPDTTPDVAGQPCADGSRAVEPNRTFPGIANPGGWEGQSYQDARRDGLLHQARPEEEPKVPPARRMIAETRALIALIEHFQPERLASIHAHSVPGGRGDGPGIFVDPRGGVTNPRDPTHSEAATPEGREDDRLAQEMLTRAESDVAGAARPDGSTNPFAAGPLRGVAPLRGNQAGRGGDTVHYEASHPRGTSLGDWAPSRGITTVTVEVPQRVTGPDLENIETMHRDLLQRVFLADPALLTPGAFGTAPSGLRGRSDAPPPRRAP
jgi:hypothetical protein